MSIYTSNNVTIFCDDCSVSYDMEGTQAEAMTEARDMGWSCGKRHLCPDCKPGASA